MSEESTTILRLLSGLEGDDGEQGWYFDRTGGRGRIGKVDLKRGIDFDRLYEFGTGVHDVPDHPERVGNVGLEKREDIVDRRRVFE